MSKKNRRKTLTKKEGYIRKSEFSVDDSKIYIILTIVMFHIVPLAFVMMGDSGQQILMLTFLMMLNPIFIALTGLIYGIKKGFNYKFPMFMGIIATVSIPMYYKFETGTYDADGDYNDDCIYSFCAFVNGNRRMAEKTAEFLTEVHYGKEAVWSVNTDDADDLQGFL